MYKDILRKDSGTFLRIANLTDTPLLFRYIHFFLHVHKLMGRKSRRYLPFEKNFKNKLKRFKL